MTIVRTASRRKWTTIDRKTLNDEGLSFRARGVLAWLLDKPDDWRCESDAIARAGTEGREAIRTALRELEAAGYLVRRKVQGEGGRWSTVTEVFERPTDAQEPVAGPTPRNPAPGEPTPGAPVAIPLELGLTTETENTPAAPQPVALDHEFERFWQAVPQPRRVGKGDARKAWPAAVRKATPDVIIAGMVRYAEETEGREPRYLKTPGPWLRAERWTDEPGANRDRDAPAAGGPRGPLPKHTAPAGRVTDL